MKVTEMKVKQIDRTKADQMNSNKNRTEMKVKQINRTKAQTR